LTTLSIQVTWDGTEPPIRQTVSVAGPDAAALGEVAALVELEPAGVVLPVAAGVVLVLELQPAIASAAAAAPATAPSAADLFLSPTAGTPSARVIFAVTLD
jgi:hypothetical protein